MKQYKSFRSGQKGDTRPAQLVTGDAGSSYTNPGFDYYAGALDAFLAQRRSSTPSLINYDKISMAQNYAGAIYLPISFAANQLSRAKPVVYQHSYNPADPDGRKRLPAFDAIYDLFKRPNPSDTLRLILYSLSQQYDLTGECYLWLPPEDSETGELSEYGEPREMYVIPSAWVSGLPSCPWWQGGAYQVTPYVSQYPGGNMSAYIPADQMMRIYDPHPLFDKTAYSVLQAISQSVDTVRAIDQARISAQEQGCQAGIAIELDPQLQNPSVVDMKRVRETFNQLYSGSRNAGKALILPPGAKFQQGDIAPKDMAWQEGWTQLTDFILACQQVNRAACGMSGDLNFATLYASIKQVYWSKLEPRLESFAQGFNKSYFDPFVGEDYFCEFELPRMDDDAQKLAGLKLDVEANAITKGQYLRERGYEVDPETTPGLNDLIRGNPAPEGDQPQQEEGQDRDEETEKNRPRNNLGGGSLGPRGNGIDEGKLFSAFERSMTRGTILPAGRN